MIPAGLLDFDTLSLPEEETGVLVIGGGVAGLSAALSAAGRRGVTLAMKSGLLDSASETAQGGVAAVLSSSDSFENHLKDTIAAGAGLVSEAAARLLVEEGPECIAELLEFGASFNRKGRELAFAREGGHSAARIIYAAGDRSGAELVRTLSSRVLQTREIEIRERYFLIDLLASGHNVVGGLFYEREKRALLVIRAASTILATGGIGQLYQETTNPSISTGDGMAAAYRAGAVLTDLEFIQFHPTVLYIAGAPRFLISEAVRGEGAYLINDRQERFMPHYHPAADLAPRDVVTRAILDQMRRRGIGNVYLDCRPVASIFRKRFPTIYNTVCRFRIDPTLEPIPVRPAVHYHMGGVKSDLEARTTLNNLFVCGETAATGVHGANRLASNSLLECLVFGRRAGRFAAENGERSRVRVRYSRRWNDFQVDFNDLRRSLNTLMWRQVGLERNGFDLELALEKINNWQSYALTSRVADPSGWEIQNMLWLAGLITRGALERTESRGAHFRTDFPERDDARWLRHLERRI
ncbi:MAG TPA: L-aspartate oxidase [bacterium]|nr:L-aspartate oxidase [bacterium]